MRELLILSPEAQTEALSDALLAVGALSVSVEDALGDTDQEIPLFGEPGTEPTVQAWALSRVVALLPDAVDTADFLADLQAYTGVDYAPQHQLREVPDNDWVRLTQSQFAPIAIGDRIWIVPSWHQHDPQWQQLPADSVCIQLDPGLAFGTGSHPTTHLCAQWLSAQLPAGATVLDYGHGSGILGIIASKLGASSVWGVDIDPAAVEAAQYNASVNQAAVQFGLPSDLPNGQFNVVVANILSNPLKVLAPMLASRVAPGGHLVLSGILTRQTQELIDAYAPYIDLTVWGEVEGWVCLTGMRK